MPSVESPTKEDQAGRTPRPEGEQGIAAFARVRDFFAKLWALDVRSLAVFRIGVALVILFDLAIRASDLEAFYTDFGLLPRSPYIQNFADPWYVSIHMMSRTFFVQACLFVRAA